MRKIRRGITRKQCGCYQSSSAGQKGTTGKLHHPPMMWPPPPVLGFVIVAFVTPPRLKELVAVIELVTKVIPLSATHEAVPPAALSVTLVTPKERGGVNIIKLADDPAHEIAFVIV